MTPTESRPDAQSDALRDICRMAAGSRTQTARLRWITHRATCALEGREFDPREVDSPSSIEHEVGRLRRQNAELKERVAALASSPATLGEAWQPIETAPRGELILYHPPETGRNAKCAMVKVDRYPTGYPRKPTHWMPLPTPPERPEGQESQP